MSALSGLDQALWDLKGKVLNLPAWEMMGGKVRDRIRAYAWIGGDRPHEIGDAARARREQGFSAIKMNATGELDWLGAPRLLVDVRSEEHTSELQSLMRLSYAVFCMKQKKNQAQITSHTTKRTATLT